MAQCVHCSTPVPEDARFCHSCGSQVSDAEGQARASAAIDASALIHIEKMLAEETSGQFEIQGLLGRGGMAVVFLATENGLGRKVAIKVLPPELTFGHGLERFKREAKTSAALDHPNIIPVYRVGGSGKLFWYAMKFLEGRSLDDVLKEKGKLPLDDSIEILAQTADALDYAHERRVVHRDIKPANVMLDGRNRVIVTDFGIAKALTEGGLTASGSVIGTPYYMSPEQGMGKPVSGASDQYSVAVMAFRMLAGQVPFEGESSIDILHKHCMSPPPPIADVAPELPPYVGRALMRAMDKKAERRFASVGQFVKALKGQAVPAAPGEVATVVMQTAGGSAATSGPGSRVPKSGKPIERQSTQLMEISDVIDRGPKPSPKKSKTPMLVGGGVAVVAVIGVAVVLMSGGKKPPTVATRQDSVPKAEVPAAVTPPPVQNPVATPTGNSASRTTPAGSTGRPAGPTRPGRQNPPVVNTPREVVTPPKATVSSVGYLQLRVSPWANVSVDAVDRGQKTTFVDTLPAGPHLVKLTRDGFVDVDTVVNIKAGEPARILVQMKNP